MSWDRLLLGVWAASWSGAAILLAVVFLRTLLGKRMPGRVFCLLWDVALARLFVPVALSSPVAIWRWLPIHLPVRMLDLNHAVTAEAGVSIGGAGIGWAAIGKAADGAIGRAAIASGRTAIGGVAASGTAMSDTTAEMVTKSAVDGMAAALAAVWLTAALALAAWFLLNHLRSRRIYAASLPCGDTFAQDWLAAHSLRRRVEIRTSDRIGAPLTYGILRPVVLVPSGMDWPDKTALSCILEHEYQHIRRFDTLRKGFLAAALCLHWFNPFVWAMYVLCNRDIELACDEAACGADRAAYARTLLDMEERRGRWILSGSHFSQNALEERIRSIMKHKHISIAALSAVLVIMSITVTVFASAPPEKASGTLSGGSRNADGSQGAPEAVDVDALLKELKAFGIDGDANRMTYNGRLILNFVDGMPVGDSGYSIAYVYANPEGVVDVHTLRSVIHHPDGSYDAMGDLIGVAAEGEEGFDRELIDSAAFNRGAQAVSADTDGEEVGTLLKKYEPFGLRYEIYDLPGASGSLRMSWNGKPIHSLYDTQTGVWFANNLNGTELPDGALDLETVYQSGRLCGLREASPDSAAPGQGVQLTYAEGNGGEGGITFEEVFAVYEPYGLVYSPREGSHLGSLTWNGQAVKSFADLKADGGAFSYQDIYVEDGLKVRTEYGADGNLMGLRAE